MDNKLFTQAIDNLQKGIDSLKEALKPKTEFKVGWIYKDGWDVEFIIKKIEDNPDFVFPIYAYLLRKDEDSPLPDLTRSYTLTGQFLSAENSKGDLILESGRPYKKEKEELEGFKVGWVYADYRYLSKGPFHITQIDKESDYPLKGYYLNDNTSSAYKPTINLSEGMPKEEWDKKYGNKQETKDCKFKVGWVYEDQSNDKFLIVHIYKDTKNIPYPIYALTLSDKCDLLDSCMPYFLSLEGVSQFKTVELDPETGRPYDK